MKQTKTNLIKKLPLILIITITITLILLAFNYGLKPLRLKAQHQAQQQYTEHIAKEINRYVFDKIKGAAIDLAKTQEVTRLIQGQSKIDNKDVLLVLSTAKMLFDASLVFVLNNEGTVISCTPYGTGKTLTGQNYNFRPYFHRALKGKEIIYPALGIATSKRGLYFSAPIYVANSKTPKGVIVIKISLKAVDTILHKQKQPIAIVSEDGIIFASNKSDWLYKDAFMNTQKQISKIIQSRQFANKPLEKLKLNLQLPQVDFQNFPYQIIKFPLAIKGWKILTLDKINKDYPISLSKKDIWVGITTVLTLIVIIILLLLNIIKRKQAELKLKIAHNELADLNSNLEKKVIDRTASIRNLLDNAGQGFLTITPDFIIEKEYSIECEKIFEQNIYNQKFSSLIYPDKKDEQLFFEKLLAKLFIDEENGKYLNLLPNEINYFNKTIQISYKIINTSKTMIILTDITEKRELEKEMEHERQNLKLIANVIINHQEFSRNLNRYYSFCGEYIPNLLKSKQPIENTISDMVRHIHTFKGNFALYNTGEIVAKLHELEHQLLDLQQLDKKAHLLENIVNFSEMKDWVDNDIHKVKSILGDTFFSKENILFIDSEKIIKIENEIKTKLSPNEHNELIIALRKLRYKPIISLLQSMPAHIYDLAKRLDKPLNEVEIIGGDVLIDPDIYMNFFESLIHVFRNAIDHGIENIQDRESKNKDKYGTIKCKIDSDNNLISICISDDGRGLNEQALVKVALEKSIITKNEVASLTQDKIFEFIFNENFSTKNQVSELSGRGFGLTAVSHELAKLKGKIIIKSKLDVGTEIVFTLPYTPIEQI
jgi:C4-dicarboxylate-specific signal transduction histidine kinase/signal transduction histidine kinase